MKRLAEIFVLLMSSVLSKRLPVENKTDNNGRTPDTKNSTEEHYNQDVAGIRRAVQPPPNNIFQNPDQACYTQFFANGQPPVGLRTANLQNIRYICQQVSAHPGTFFYATMFDEGRGIAVYSAYVLHADNVEFQAQGASTWIQTPGIQRQGSNQVYAGQGQQCHKGHLFPALTASGFPQNPQFPLNVLLNRQNSARSTYQYTNAVPQCGSFNTGQWRVFEGQIREHARQCTAQNGRMYLITGASFVGFQGTPPQPFGVPINQLQVPNNPAIASIDIPNLMWTTGSCVIPNAEAAERFAVIGNNVRTPQDMQTQYITWEQLDAIIQFDNQINGLKRSTVKQEANLFPGIKKSVNVKLPSKQYPTPEKSG